MKPTFTMDDPPKRASSMSFDEAMAEYIRLDRQVKEAANDRAWAASILSQRAMEERDGQKTVHLENHDRSQSVRVTFNSQLEVIDESEILTVAQLLGAERFAEIFQVKYIPRARIFKTFMNTGSSDESIQTAKAILKDAVKDIPKNPTLGVERS